MPQFLPLFLPNPLLELVNKEQVEKDSHLLKEYFETDRVDGARQLLEKQNANWVGYLEKLAESRHEKLFGTKITIDEEETKIEELAKQGKPLAKEFKIIIEMKSAFKRKWPVLSIEKKKEEYVKLMGKNYSSAKEQRNWIISNALAEIYFPPEFFSSKIFKLEQEYASFPFDFLEDTLGPVQLYIWYLIYVKKGPANFLSNLQDVIILRYKVKGIISMDTYGLLNWFMCNGNDQNNCNRFFTRRMKKDVDRELGDWCALVNNIGGKYEEDSFKHFFMSNPWSHCHLRDPFQEVIDSEPSLIEQAIYNHLVGNYSSSVNLLFPIIEGICWDISVAEHLKNSGIYATNSDLTTRDLKKRILLDDNGQPLAIRHGTPTLKELLEQTRMKNIFHIQFLKLVCSELYPEERNPILHGITLDYNSPFQSARLFLMLEYLHVLIKKRGYGYPDQLDPNGYWTPEKSGKRAQ